MAENEKYGFAAAAGHNIADNDKDWLQLLQSIKSSCGHSTENNELATTALTALLSDDTTDHNGGVTDAREASLQSPRESPRDDKGVARTVSPSCQLGSTRLDTERRSHDARAAAAKFATTLNNFFDLYSPASCGANFSNTNDSTPASTSEETTGGGSSTRHQSACQAKNERGDEMESKHEQHRKDNQQPSQQRQIPRVAGPVEETAMDSNVGSSPGSLDFSYTKTHLANNAFALSEDDPLFPFLLRHFPSSVKTEDQNDKDAKTSPPSHSNTDEHKRQKEEKMEPSSSSISTNTEPHVMPLDSSPAAEFLLQTEAETQDAQDGACQCQKDHSEAPGKRKAPMKGEIPPNSASNVDAEENGADKKDDRSALLRPKKSEDDNSKIARVLVAEPFSASSTVDGSHSYASRDSSMDRQTVSMRSAPTPVKSPGGTTEEEDTDALAAVSVEESNSPVYVESVGFLTNSDVRHEDVLCGRGAHATHHNGNQVLRQDINEVLQQYVEASKQEKTKIADAIVKKVTQRGGRFLKMVEDSTEPSHDHSSDDRKSGKKPRRRSTYDEGNLWEVLPYQQARAKVSQRFRQSASSSGS